MHYHIPVTRIFLNFGKNSWSAPTQVFKECGLESSPLPPPRIEIWSGLGSLDFSWTGVPPAPHQGLMWELVCGD